MGRKEIETGYPDNLLLSYKKRRAEDADLLVAEQKLVSYIYSDIGTYRLYPSENDIIYSKNDGYNQLKRSSSVITD